MKVWWKFNIGLKIPFLPQNANCGKNTRERLKALNIKFQVFKSLSCWFSVAMISSSNSISALVSNCQCQCQLTIPQHYRSITRIANAVQCHPLYPGNFGCQKCKRCHKSPEAKHCNNCETAQVEVWIVESVGQEGRSDPSAEVWKRLWRGRYLCHYCSDCHFPECFLRQTQAIEVYGTAQNIWLMNILVNVCKLLTAWTADTE